MSGKLLLGALVMVWINGLYAGVCLGYALRGLSKRFDAFMERHIEALNIRPRRRSKAGTCAACAQWEDYADCDPSEPRGYCDTHRRWTCSDDACHLFEARRRNDEET